jgi:WD40 repeat protein
LSTYAWLSAKLGAVSVQVGLWKVSNTFVNFAEVSMASMEENSSPMRRAHFAIAEDNGSDNGGGGTTTDSRTKKPPPITPRRFTKFFTPRPRNASKAVRTSRKALRNITGPALNSRSTKGNRPAENLDIVSMPTIDENEQTRSSRKRKYSTYSATPSIASSPIRAGGFLSSSQETRSRLEDCSKKLREEEEAETELEDSLEDSSDEEECIPVPARIPYRSTSTSASILSTRLTGRRSRKEVPGSHAWQDETGSFVSSPEDVYECSSGIGHAILPFCVASCNTNTLIAIGEEEGGIRLIESAAGDKQGFSREFLSFRPHDNAIMDLEFSDDDRLLATASGDQTSHIIDMTTQQSIFCLGGHHSSIKRIQFQPNTNNHVVATCSRDGSVRVWDLRSPAMDRPSFHLRSAGRADESPGRHPNIRYVPTANTIQDAHGLNYNKSINPRYRNNPVSARNDYSVTSIAFLGASRPSMLVTASEAHAVVKLWDMRATYTNARGIRYRAVPVSSTAEPATHLQNRSYGLTSLALGGDGARLYGLCRDNTIYTYATSHLILGDSNLSTIKPSIHNPQPTEATGLAPLYGLVHPRLRVATFYPRLAVRKAHDGHSELLAAGSTDDCAVLFPTDERYLTASTRVTTDNRTLARTSEYPMKIYSHGTPLTRAHNKEVTAVTWTSEGSLVTVSDDFSSRCWRENANEARDLRLKGEAGGRRWMMGWAQTDVLGYDDE